MTQGTQSGVAAVPALKRPTWVRVLRLARAQPMGAAGAMVVVLVGALAVAAPFLARYDPNQVMPASRLAPPSAQHWFGADYLGRDVFSRVLYGARVSLLVGISTVLVSTSVGLVLGVLSAYLGGKFDLIVQRGVDILLSFPTLVMALALMVALGRGVHTIVAALAIVNSPQVIRAVRSVALSVKAETYIEAARAVGASDWRILARHLAPNCLVPVIVLGTGNLGWAIVVEASLSFLGVGVPPTVPSWGGMLSGLTQRVIVVAPWVVVFPGLALSLTVLAVNLLGDSLRDILDPRLKG